jgi:hypothetical protein
MEGGEKDFVELDGDGLENEDGLVFTKAQGPEAGCAGRDALCEFAESHDAIDAVLAIDDGREIGVLGCALVEDSD